MILPVDKPLAQQAATLAAQYRLRGSDAIYVAVAYRFGCALITLDLEQLQRVKTIVITRTPAEENSQLGLAESKGQ
jgi:predicted nucleic acid-binding protein